MKIFLIGFMGCGKTHWGKLLSAKLGMPFFDLDEKIEEHEARTIAEIFAKEGEEYFRLLEKDVLHLLTESHEGFVMATGGGTPCFYNNIDYLKKQGTVVWINCSTECLYQRLVKEKEKRPLISNISDVNLKDYIIKKYSGRKIYYQQANVILPEENITLENVLNKIFHAKS
ncbi:MAG: shikimate kinase [Flavisolibacter sp.]